MKLEDYFDFSNPTEIRYKEHRIWMHNLLVEYVRNGLTVEEMAERFPTLSREELFAALLYYHGNKEAMDKHLADYIEYCEKSREGTRNDPFYMSLRERMKKVKTERERQNDSVVDR